MSKAKIVAVSISAVKGKAKENQAKINLIENYGVENDAHAGASVRQVSLLAMESIEKMLSLGVEVSPGSFAENITTEGLNLTSLKVGDILAIGPEVLLKISQLGKVCHDRCAIYHQVGTCVMPEEGVFGIVLAGGEIKPGDLIVSQKS